MSQNSSPLTPRNDRSAVRPHPAGRAAAGQVPPPPPPPPPPTWPHPSRTAVTPLPTPDRLNHDITRVRLRYGLLWRPLLAVLMLAMPGCQKQYPAQPSTVTAALDEATQACFLDLLNQCDKDVGWFDDELGWDRRAAEVLVEWRDGSDGICGTDDDRAFTSLAEVDALPWVGPSALARLHEALRNTGCAGESCAGVEAGLVAGVAFTARQAHDVLDFVRRGSGEALQSVSGVGPATAARLLEDRPSSLSALDAIHGVGPFLLAAFRDEAPRSWCSRPEAECGCESTTAAQVLATMTDPGWSPGSRFRQLLGQNGYERLARAFAPEVAEGVEAGAQLHEAAASALSQAVFTRPFEVLGPTLPEAGASTPNPDAATDALVLALGVSDLRSSSVGVSYDELVRWNEPEYLADVQRWRSGEFEVQTLDHAWLLYGTVLGIPAWVTMSRSQASPPSVVLEFDL